MSCVGGGGLLGRVKAYMSDDHGGDDEAGKRQAVADFLHNSTSRPQSRRCDIRAAVIIDYNSDGDVCNSHNRLASKERSSVVSWLSHLGRDGEEGRCAGKGKDVGRNRGDAVDKVRRADDFVVRLPWTFRGGGGPILNTDGNGDAEDCLRDVSHRTLKEHFSVGL